VGMLKIHNLAMNLEELLRDIESMYGYRANEKGLEFEAEIEPGTPVEVYADAHRFRQILYNLVGNAVKFTEQGKVQLKIQGTQRKGNSADLRILVSDTGIGINSEEHESIFDAFTQQRAQEERFGGTGLGLTITRRLAEAMDGSISVHSEAGKGSTFIVHFPHLQLQQTGSEMSGTRTNGGSGLYPDSSSPNAPASANSASESSVSSSSPQPVDLKDSLGVDFNQPILSKAKLLEWLSGPGMQEWSRISDSLFVDDIREFSLLLQRRGNEYQAAALIEYGELLEQHVTTLNLEVLKRSLSQFPEVVEKLRQAPEA